MTLSIELCALSKYFPLSASQEPVKAVNGLNNTIMSGRITGLVGPDGAGKTTLMRLMAGLLKPSAGEIRIHGMTAPVDNSTLRSLIGYMPQKFGLYEDLTVQENLDLYADLRDITKDERQRSFSRLLEFTNLAHFTRRYAGKLSGGMKQKLGLACTLLGAPQILLLDEPGVGVDPISRRELWKMVSELAQRGMTIVWSTSYLDEAELCDSVILMNQGQIEASGAPQQLMTPMKDRVIHVIQITENRRDVLQHALRAPEVIDGVIQGINIRLVLRNAKQYPQIESLHAGPQAKLIAAAPRLEDVFISLLGKEPGGDSVLAQVMPETILTQRATVKPVIEANKLTKCFGAFVAADAISFSVSRGEIFGLLGPNGAGKSTTFKMMCGLLKPSSGEAYLMGIDLKSSAAKARQCLGYMAQKFSLYGNLTVRQNLVFFSGIYGLRGKTQHEKIQQMIEVFALSPYLRTDAGLLPLGFKQRLALACAVMHEPPLLFLDEPTSGVDPVTRREFWTHINALVDKGVSIMITTHFMDEAEYCDRIGLIYQGKMIASGAPDELKQQVSTPEHPNPTMEDAFIKLIMRAGQ